jgi:hypothetical protein
MGNVEKLISFAISLGLMFAAAGQLPRATLWLIRHTPDGGPHLISLGKMNRALRGSGQHFHQPKSHI